MSKILIGWTVAVLGVVAMDSVGALRAQEGWYYPPPAASCYNQANYSHWFYPPPNRRFYSPPDTFFYPAPTDFFYRAPTEYAYPPVYPSYQMPYDEWYYPAPTYRYYTP